MTRSLLLAAAAAASLAFGVPQAKAYVPPTDQAWTGHPAPLDLYWPPPLSNTRQDSISASPSCGAANPQGGVRSPVTWGDCP